jgi:hypothetical protein
MSKIQTLLFIVAGIFIVFVVMIFTPVPNATNDNVDLVKGVIEKVYEPCCLDVSFRLIGDSRNYYINRGIECGISPDQMHNDLQGKEVEMKIIQHWTPLDWNKSLGSIAEIRVGEEIVFSAIN